MVWIHNCVPLGKLFDSPMLTFLHLCNGDVVLTTLDCWEEGTRGRILKFLAVWSLSPSPLAFFYFQGCSWDAFTPEEHCSVSCAAYPNKHHVPGSRNMGTSLTSLSPTACHCPRTDFLNSVPLVLPLSAPPAAKLPSFQAMPFL